MADTALLAAGGDDAPLDYLVPGATSIRIKQIHVSYSDDGASGDWLPAVRIVSDSAHTMGVAADQGVVVTAGDDAGVSFFPGVKHASASGAVVTPLGFVQYTDPVGLLPAGNNYLPIAVVTSTPPGLISASIGLNLFAINKTGTYLFTLSFNCSNGHATDETIVAAFDTGAGTPDFLQATGEFFGAVLPSVGVAANTAPQGVTVGVVTPGNNLCNLRLATSDTLTVSGVDLVVAQLTTGTI